MEIASERNSTHENNFDARKYLDIYYAIDPVTQQVDIESRFILSFLHKVFASGLVEGENLIEIGSGPVLYHILSACERFNKIYLTDYFEANLQEIEKWLKGDKNAFDWTPYFKFVCDLESNGSTPKDKEKKIRKSVTLMRCDVTKANPLQPVSLPQTDCVIISGCLICACKTFDDFTDALKNIVSLIRPGGYLTIVDYLGASYYLIGDEKFPVLSLDEDIVRKAVAGAGCAIDEFKTSDNFDIPHETFDCKRVFCLLAHKL
ncbi:nicotinamide N-methyltransferase-like [Rhinophrynus dorsalis]